MDPWGMPAPSPTVMPTSAGVSPQHSSHQQKVSEFKQASVHCDGLNNALSTNFFLGGLYKKI